MMCSKRLHSSSTPSARVPALRSRSRSRAAAGVNIDIISTSEIRISVLVRDVELDTAVRALHEAFELGSDQQAVVHAGSGR